MVNYRRRIMRISLAAAPATPSRDTSKVFLLGTDSSESLKVSLQTSLPVQR